MSTSSEDMGTYSSPPSEDGGCYCCWPISYVRRWKPGTLPEALNIDGKHVWEPPIFAYTHLIGEEYEKKREAVLKYTKGDRAKATQILDIGIEGDTLLIYRQWLQKNVNEAKLAGDLKTESFFAGIYAEVDRDGDDLENAYDMLGISQKRSKDGKWEIKGESEDWSESLEGLHSSSSEDDSNDSSVDASRDDDERSTDNTRICTTADDEEELIWLSTIDPEAYPPLQSDGEADDEEPNASSDSDAYMDARSTISEEDEKEDSSVPEKEANVVMVHLALRRP